jgi:hypothetical protein
MVKAYEVTEGKHTHRDQMRQLGLPMYSDILFTPRHFDLLGKIFEGWDYWINGNTLSRRVAMASKPPHWMLPLAPHLDAFVNDLEFTVNFWVPFQACGVDAPSLAVVLAPFHEMVAYTGFQNGAEVWVDPQPFKKLTRFRPAMKALFRELDPVMLADMNERFRDRIRMPTYEPGDAMMISNYTLHITHSTPNMTKSRESLELRFSSSASLEDILGHHGITSPYASRA